ncbi:MAG: hypothetical protein HW421_2654 [Ignavibacteria bacterium]|nr:hypothetical protein [Ignavibacteria bacterium]
MREYHSVAVPEIPTLKSVAKLSKMEKCHSERSEESSLNRASGFFTSLTNDILLDFHTARLAGII